MGNYLRQMSKNYMPQVSPPGGYPATRKMTNTEPGATEAPTSHEDALLHREDQEQQATQDKREGQSTTPPAPQEE